MIQGMGLKRLDAREARAWRGFQQMRAQLTAHLARQLEQESGLTEAEYAVLVVVSEAAGRRIRARDLCETLGWERSRLSHQIDRMENRGVVERAPCAGDARGFDLVLTSQGLAIIEAAAPLHLAAVRRCFADVLSRQQLDALGDIAEAIITHLADANIEPCPATAQVRPQSG